MAEFIHTEFKSKYSSKGKAKTCELLMLIAEPIQNCSKTNQKDNLLIRPFVDNLFRHPQQDQLFSAAVLDLDDSEDDLTGIKAKLSKCKSEMFIYSTWNHLCPGYKNRWRIIIPFKYPRNWAYTKRVIDFASQKANIKPDATCIHEERGFYAPQVNPNGRYEYGVIHYESGRIDQIQQQYLNPVNKPVLNEETKDETKELKERKKPVKLRSPIPLFVHEEGRGVQVANYQDFQKLWVQRSIQNQLLKFLGVNDMPLKSCSHGALSKTFRSPLFSHDDQNPSWTAIWLQDRQEIVLKCHGSILESRSVWGLIDVYYANITQDTVTVLSGPERVVWQTRMMIDAGVIRDADIRMRDLPEDTTAYIKRVYDGFRSLLRVKWAITEFNQRSTCFSRKFAARWSGVSVASASRAIKWLHDNNYLQEDGVFASVKGMVMSMYRPASVLA